MYYNIANPFELIWFLSPNFVMKDRTLIKKLVILEKRIEYLESKIKSNISSDLREEKWSEFQSIIRLQEKNNGRKALN